jgi:hypothetical protein
MSLLKELLKETAASGSIGAGAVAFVPMPLMKGKQGKMLRRVTKEGTLLSGGQLNVVFPKKQKLFSKVVREGITGGEQHFDMADVISKLDAAEKKDKAGKDTVTFGLEDDDGKIVRVSVRADQAENFESALGQMLSGNDKNEDNQNSQMEIAEVLFKLKDQFDIIDVDWGQIPEDEEQEQTVNVDDEEIDREPKDDKQETENQDMSGADTGAQSALIAVIDMLKADAEAKKAEAEAREAEARAKEAEYAAKAAEAKVRQEEEILDMETAEKEKREKEKEAKMLAKLAKHRHEKAKEAESMLGYEQEELGGANIPYDPKNKKSSMAQLRDAIFYNLRAR